MQLNHVMYERTLCCSVFKSCFRVHSALRGLPWYGTQSPSPPESFLGGVPEKVWPAKIWRDNGVEPAILKPTTQCQGDSIKPVESLVKEVILS